MKRIAAVAAGALIICVVSWWGFSPRSYTPRYPGFTEPVEKPATQPAIATAEASSTQTLRARPDAGPLAVKDMSIYDEPDEPQWAVETVTDEEISKALDANAAFAAREVGRFCELTGQVAASHLFNDKQGKRDASEWMHHLFGIDERDSHVELPMPVRASLARGDGTELTAEQVMGVQFGWMSKLHAYDRLSLDYGKYTQLAEYAPLPNPKFYSYLVRARVLRAAALGDWEATVADIQALADLLRSAGTADAGLRANDVLRLEAKTIDAIKQRGDAVPAHLKVPSGEALQLHRALTRDAARFVMPRVAPEVQARAMVCARQAGMHCALAYDSVSNAHQLDGVVKFEPVSLDHSGCNEFKLAHLGFFDIEQDPAALTAELKAAPLLFNAEPSP